MFYRQMGNLVLFSTLQHILNRYSKQQQSSNLTFNGDIAALSPSDSHSAAEGDVAVFMPVMEMEMEATAQKPKVSIVNDLLSIQQKNKNEMCFVFFSIFKSRMSFTSCQSRVGGWKNATVQSVIEAV